MIEFRYIVGLSLPVIFANSAIYIFSTGLRDKQRENRKLDIKDGIILDDVTAHHSFWFSALGYDARGNDIAVQIDNSGFRVLNEDMATRVTVNCRNSPRHIKS